MPKATRAKVPAKNSADSALDRIVREKLAALREQSRGNLAELEIFDFMVTASPHLRKPEHLAAVVPFMEAIDESPQAFALSAPPRHGKSVLVNHLVARQMIRHPGLRVAYGCYNLDLAGFNSLEVKDILLSNNIEIDKTQNSKEEWRLANGSVFKCVAPGSGFTGRGADLIVIDDPYKGRTEAESGRIRDATWSWFTAVAITRRSPHASVIVTHTRWTIDDLIGRVVEKHKWPYVNLQAINDQGDALWPDEWSADKLAEIRSIIGPYEWASLYMGEPRPRGGAVFGDPQTYGGFITTLNGEKSIPNPYQLPAKFKKIVIGIDCAYTKKTHSDYSCAVVLGVDEDGIHYILDVVRKQCEAPEFEKDLRALRFKYGNPPIYWYTGGTEKAVADFFINRGVPVKAVPAKDDKFVRAQAVAAAWNAGKVRMPADDTAWSRAFLSEVLLFTGLDDPHDDQVDALAAAFIPSAGKKIVRGPLEKRLLSF
jgi:predicted phage terminase large subunit-like protein